MGILSSGAIRIVLFLVIGGAIGVGGLIFRDRISGGATDLRVGDCFDAPTAAGLITEVQHHPCIEPHTAELFGLFDYPGRSSDPYPSQDAFDTFAGNQCLPAFRSYTGRDPLTDPLLTLGTMYPSAEGWKDGDQVVNCYLYRLDEGSMTQSYRVTTT